MQDKQVWIEMCLLSQYLDFKKKPHFLRIHLKKTQTFYNLI